MGVKTPALLNVRDSGLTFFLKKQLLDLVFFLFNSVNINAVSYTQLTLPTKRIV